MEPPTVHGVTHPDDVQLRTAGHQNLPRGIAKSKLNRLELEGQCKMSLQAADPTAQSAKHNDNAEPKSCKYYRDGSEDEY